MKSYENDRRMPLLLFQRGRDNIRPQHRSNSVGCGCCLWIIPILALLVIVSALRIFDRWQESPQNLYAAAVVDAVTAESEEIESLVELSLSNDFTTWDAQGRVLLLSWHSLPELYREGDTMHLSKGEIWTFTDKEIAMWYETNESGITNWPLRLEQLIGLPPDSGYTHMSGFWADPGDVVRPAYVTDITGQMQLTFPADTAPAFEEWFYGNMKFSYEESAYPWTRLGYTYDWADNNVEYGLTEFLIEQGAPVQIAFTKTTEDFLDWLSQGAPVNALTQ